MPRVKLAVILPVLFCGVEGLLRYWNLHSDASIPNTIGWLTAANFISEGLNFPAVFLGVLFFIPLNDHLPPRAVILLLMLVLVAGLWYLIGYWLDHRGQVSDPSRQKGVFSSVVLPALVLVCGIGTLGYSFARAQGLHISNFIQTIYIALLQTWAVFLIGIPAVGMARHFLGKSRENDSADSLSRPHMRVSNFRLFELIVGVFVVLLLLWLPHGPHSSK